MYRRGRTPISTPAVRVVVLVAALVLALVTLPAVLPVAMAQPGATRAVGTVEDILGGLLASRAGLLRVGPGSLPQARLLGEALDPRELAAISGGRFLVLDGREALGWARSSRRVPWGSAVVVVNPPEVFRGESAVSRGRLALEMTRAAVRLGATLIVDCTDADLARLTPEGQQSLTVARRAGLLRMVVFDGAHHLPGLGLQPEIVLAPVSKVGGITYITHGYVRDAVPWSDLARARASLAPRSVVLVLPRLSTPVKSKRPLGVLGREALRLIAAAARPNVLAAQRLGGCQESLAVWQNRPRPASGGVADGLVRTESGVAVSSLSLAPGRARAELQRVRELARRENEKTPIHLLWLGVGYGNVSLVNAGRTQNLSRAARLAAELGRSLPTSQGPVDLRVQVAGLPYSFWDLACLWIREAIAGFLAGFAPG